MLHFKKYFAVSLKKDVWAKRNERIRIGWAIYRVIARFGSWHFLERID